MNTVLVNAPDEPANPMTPEDLLDSVRTMLRHWAAEDAARMQAATAPARQAEGKRYGYGAASTVPYVLDGIPRRA